VETELSNEILVRLKHLEKAVQELGGDVKEFTEILSNYRVHQEVLRQQVARLTVAADNLTQSVGTLCSKQARLESQYNDLSKDVSVQSEQIWKIVWKILPWVGVLALVAERVWGGG
jgi:chromosome segregation ATPase